MARFKTPDAPGLTVDAVHAWIVALLLLAGCALAVYDGVVILLCYTRVDARVERVAMLCQPSGQPIEQAAECGGPPPAPAGTTLESPAVYVTYTSPADGRKHHERLVAQGKRQRMQLLRLRPGDSWIILAHDTDPRAIKMLN